MSVTENGYKKTKIVLMMTSLILLVATLFTLVSCNESSEDAEYVETTALMTEFVNAENIKLTSASPMMMSTRGTPVITQRLTAIVMPANASNKMVDWSVEWAEENSANVSDYITVTPDSDGSESATVTCKAAFSGNIIITATTRQNGFKATCIVRYVGIPANIDIVTELTPNSDGYHIAGSNIYTFNVQLSNPFGEVGNDYKSLVASVNATGKILVANKEVYNDGGVKWFDDGTHELDISTVPSKFISATISEDGVLTLDVKRSIEGYWGSITRIDGGRTQYFQDAFKSYVSDCYFDIVLTEPNSGVSTSFRVVIDKNAVSSVSMDDGELLF